MVPEWKKTQAWSKHIRYKHSLHMEISEWGIALTVYVVPGCMEDGTWMLWKNLPPSPSRQLIAIGCTGTLPESNKTEHNYNNMPPWLNLQLETETWNRSLKPELETDTWNSNLKTENETQNWTLTTEEKNIRKKHPRAAPRLVGLVGSFQ